MTRALHLDHLHALSTSTGLFEHARFTRPRFEHGMCVDDVARALIVTVRVAEPDAATRRLTSIYLDFLLDAQVPDGRSRNRRSPEGDWLDEPSEHDHWGRSLWALGVTAAAGLGPVVTEAAARGASRALAVRSPHLRATAYAALGAVALLDLADDSNAAARAFLLDARASLPRRSAAPWPWPEPRLSYANAVLPEAMIAVGHALEDAHLVGEGLDLLRWLVRLQTRAGRFSFVPAGGLGPQEALPAFDQQPIEAAALAEAAATAWRSGAGPEWLDVLETAVRWFEGENDGATPLRDAERGGCRDGLLADGANENQGAESTLAWLSTLQLHADAHGSRLVAAPAQPELAAVAP